MDRWQLLVYLILIHWKVINQVDSTIQLLNNLGHDIFIVF